MDFIFNTGVKNYDSTSEGKLSFATSADDLMKVLNT